MKKAILISVFLAIAALPVQAAWQVDGKKSQVSFITEKVYPNDQAAKETSLITGVSGRVSNQKQAEIKIDLDTINTSISIRDERIKKWLIDLTQYRYATVKADLPALDEQKINIGKSVKMTAKGSLAIRDKTLPITLFINVKKDSSTQYTVTSYAPTLINTHDFDSKGGLKKLTEVMGLNSINSKIPVHWKLVLFKVYH